MKLDICCKCKKPIKVDEPRYGGSIDPCHWDCRPGGALDYRIDKTREEVEEMFSRGDRALAELRKLTSGR